MAHDVWEHLLLDDEAGIAASYGLPKDKVEQIGQQLWKAYDRRGEEEAGDWRQFEQEYWQEFIIKCSDMCNYEFSQGAD